jgi:hypothetical protein
MLARFHQASAGIGHTDGMAVFNNYPASRDCKLDCVRSLPVDLGRHAPVQRLAVCRVVQDTQHAKGNRLGLARHTESVAGRFAAVLGRQTAQARRSTGAQSLCNFRAARDIHLTPIVRHKRPAPAS